MNRIVLFGGINVTFCLTMTIICQKFKQLFEMKYL